MGFWRDLGSTFGVCDEYSQQERRDYQRERATELTGHPMGCNCHWCQCANDRPVRRDD